MELQLVENKLIKIYEGVEKRRLIDARELHMVLGNKRQFSDWIKQRIEQYELVENEDYMGFSQNCEKPMGGRPTKEYFFTIDTAKEICMIENNEMGRKIRKYFIESEKSLKTIMNVNIKTNDILEIINSVLEYNEEKFEIIERKIEDVDDKIQSINITIKKTEI